MIFIDMGEIADDMLNDYYDPEYNPDYEFHEIKFESVLRETDRAWLVRFPMNEKLVSQEHWLPKSQCSDPDTVTKIIEIRSWLITENDLWDHAV